MIQHERNKGYGSSLKTGIQQSSGKWICITDADGTYPVKRFADFIKLIPKYDMVVRERKGKYVKIPFFRKPAKWFLSKLANYLSGVEIPDLNSGMRIFRMDIAIRFFSLFPDGFSFTTTLTIAAHTNDYSVKYVPIDYYKRKGKSTIHPIKDFTNFVYLIIRMVLYFKPMNVFIPLSAILFLIGFLKAIRDFILLNHFGSGVVMVMLTAVQIFILGLLADLITRRTKL